MAEVSIGSTPPPEGDWNITEDTVVQGMELNVTGDIHVTRSIELRIVDSVIRVASSRPHQHTLRVAEGATLIVQDSTLYLDTFESDPRSTLQLVGGSTIHTKGRCILRSHDIVADYVTFHNEVPKAGTDLDGERATFIIDGRDSLEFRNVMIFNNGGDAGETSPGADGRAAGASVLISNVTTWVDCTIDCTAGRPGTGGLGLMGSSGGSGGRGGDVVVSISASTLEGVKVIATASGGGIGARGASKEADDAGSGGNGNVGGNATIEIDADDVLQMMDCRLSVMSGAGGSGGSGGSTLNGIAGDGGSGNDAGVSLIKVTCYDTVYINGSELTAYGGIGGYGGDYGRADVDPGQQGFPGLGGHGGLARIDMTGPYDLFLEDVTFRAKGGPGMDGGGGHDQGAKGGDGADGEIIVYVEGTLEASSVDLLAEGGDGGPGGPAYSDIQGNGGDGGNGTIVFTGLVKMDVEESSIYVNEGEGGQGNKPIYDGSPGIPTLDVETNTLYLSNSTLNMPLDDLSGDARGYLYNVRFDMDFGLILLPTGGAIGYESHPVDVLVVDDADPAKASPLVGWTVSVFQVETGALVAEDITDVNGLCHFDLRAFEYTSQSVNYVGSYHFIASSPDGKTTKTVRFGVIKPTQVRIDIAPWPPFIHLTVEDPEEGKEYKLYTAQGDHLETKGFIVDGETITSVLVQLLPGDDSPDDWPSIKLGLSPVPYEDLADKEDRWGKYFPPDEHSNKWPFYFRFPVASDEVEYFSGTWDFHVVAHTEDDTFASRVSFDLLVDANLDRPWVQVDTAIHGETFNGAIIIIEGTAGDDYQLLLVEARVDSGDWVSVGTAEEWTFTLDTGLLGEGYHMIDFRAFDGREYSLINSHSFEVHIEGGENGNGGGGGRPGWDTRMFLIAGGVALIAVAVVLLLAVAISRRRSPPDS